MALLEIMTSHDIENFDALLEDAERNARTEFEMDVVAGVSGRFSKYGDKTLISEKQLALLERIANR